MEALTRIKKPSFWATNLDSIGTRVVEAERSILRELNVENRLIESCSRPDGLKQFAETFYFVRVDFCRLNFIVGARCGKDDSLTGGLVENLWEEHGGKNGRTHNQLYRDFLKSVGARPESLLSQSPHFAARFNDAWERFCADRSLLEAYCAIGIYEAFDNPDYRMLLNVMREVAVPKSGLRFFGVHAGAAHFELFEGELRRRITGETSMDHLANAGCFVFERQYEMWLGLLKAMESV